jgi:hypothetical protein
MKTAIKNVLNSTNPGVVAMKIMDSKFGNNPMWTQAKQMANTGNAKEKATNMFKERGVDIEKLVNDTLKEINSLK